MVLRLKDTISSEDNNRGGRGRSVSWFVAVIVFVCVTQLEQFGASWKQLVTSATSQQAGSSNFRLKTTHRSTTPRLKSKQELIVERQICSKLPPGWSASKVWKHGLPVIEQALRHPLDTNFTHREWTHSMLQLLQPFLLEGSIRSQPSWQLVFPILVKLAKHLKDPQSHPPLKIVVMGGSIPEGVQCSRPPLHANELPFRSLQDCSWPNRLNIFFDHVFRTFWNISSSPIQVKNIATGGTGTSAATPVVEYWLNEHFQSSASESGSTLDMIINGYAANDNLPDGWWKADDVNTTLSSSHFLSNLRNAMFFARAVANMNAPAEPTNKNDTTNGGTDVDRCHAQSQNHKHGPPDPLLLFLNDYYGNQQLSILGDGQRDEGVQWLTEMHDHTGYVSPAHASVHRWIWANVDDEIFSGIWVKRNKVSVDVHYGMAGHIADTISIAYYLLQLALGVCEQVATFPNTNDLGSSAIPTATGNKSTTQVNSAADTFSNGHVPDEYISLERQESEELPFSIHESSWPTFATTPHTCGESSTEQDAMSSKHETQTGGMTNNTVKNPCTFAFLTAAMGSHKTVGATSAYLKPFTKVQQGWSVENNFRHGGFQNKMGLVAKGLDATMVLTTGNKIVQQPIQFVTVYYLKSYGDEWEGSRVKFDVEVFGPPNPTADDANPVAPLLHTENFSLEGFHNQTNSINYVFKQELGVAVPVGGSMQLTMTLVGGNQFKMIALMWCSK